MKDLEGELSAEEKANIETAISELKDAIKGNDRAQIEDKLKVLTNVSGKMAERVYAKKSTENQTQSQEAPQEAKPSDEGGKKPEEGVVDAEFEEVQDDKK